MSEAEALEARLSGELSLPPRGAISHALQLISGVAMVRAGARLVGRLALAYRNPAELRLTERGLDISYRTELLGRVLREGTTVIPLANLASIAREIRYPRLGLYAGLAALVAGTYVGAGLVVDGVRVPGGSPSLLGLGLATIAGSVLLDFLLASVWPIATRTCRVVVTPYHGRATCLEGLEPAEADRVLGEVARATAEGSTAAETAVPAAVPSMPAPAQPASGER